MNKTAILLGATGLTGSILLQKLINDNRYSTIKLFSRNRLEGLPNKVEQHIGNLLHLENFKSDFTGDEIYCCIGTTAKKTPDKKQYKKIDVGIPVSAAKLAKENKIPSYLVISALGADSKSRIFYNRIKGEMEEAILSENLKKTHLLQPSFIVGNRNEQRVGEKIGILLFRLIQPLLIGKLKKYRITKAEDIAKAMIQLANSDSSQVRVTSDSIASIANK